jgi:hypothetical protein
MAPDVRFKAADPQAPLANLSAKLTRYRDYRTVGFLSVLVQHYL